MHVQIASLKNAAGTIFIDIDNGGLHNL